MCVTAGSILIETDSFPKMTERESSMPSVEWEVKSWSYVRAIQLVAREAPHPDRA